MIDDEAVEAAAKVMALEMGTPSSPTIYRHLARKALEAAAPHMCAQALDTFADRMASRSRAAVEHESWRSKQ